MAAPGAEPPLKLRLTGALLFGTALIVVQIAGPGRADAAVTDVPCTGAGGGPAGIVTAVTSANSASGADTIRLEADCTYTFSTVNNNWFGPNALPAIASNITIDGNGATIARSSAGGTPNFRFFYVGADATDPDTDNYTSPGPGQLTLRNVTLSGGIAKGGDGVFGGGGGAGMGGAIFSMGEVTLYGVTIAMARAAGGNGGTGRDPTPGCVYGGGGGEGVAFAETRMVVPRRSVEVR